MDQQKITDEQQSNPLPDGVVEITAQEFDSVYEQVVRPDRAVYLSAYFHRWLKFIGPDLGWLYVAYRQAAYSAGARNGVTSNRFSGDVIAGLCGTSERTYWNRVGNPNTWEKLKGLVKVIDTGKEWDKSSSTPRRLPRRYMVAMTLPLTPADSASLRRWLTANIESFGGPEQVLRAASVTPLEKLIPIDASMSDDDEPETARSLVRELFKDQLDAKLLEGLASAIQQHIAPSKDQIVITLYFIEKILPHLGASPAWMLTILRDRCFADPDTGEQRNRVTVKGGYREIAGWLGMSRAKTVWEWMNEKYPDDHKEAGKLKNAVFQAYVAEVSKETLQLDFENQPRTFDVLLQEVPNEIIHTAVTLPEGDDFDQWRDFQYRSGATFSNEWRDFQYRNGAIFSNEWRYFHSISS